MGLGSQLGPQRQHAGIGVTRSLNVSITSTRVETIVELNINVVRREVLSGSVAKLGSRSGGILVGRNLGQSSALPIVTIGVVGILQMVFTNLITVTHGNRTANRPLMNSMVAKRCKSVNVMHSRGGDRKPIVITTSILDYKDGHYVRPNRVALKYPDFKKDVDLNAHVRVCNFIVKANAKTSKEYIINEFSYT